MLWNCIKTLSSAKLISLDITGIFISLIIMGDFGADQFSVP